MEIGAMGSPGHVLLLMGHGQDRREWAAKETDERDALAAAVP